MICKKCGNEVNKNSMVCLNCGSKIKKPIYKKWWFCVLIVFVIIIVASSGNSSENNETSSGTVSSSKITETSKDKDKKITYDKVDLQQMLDELNSNALKAEKSYQGKYVQVDGKIKTFDSDGSYISIEPVNANEWSFDTVTCYIKKDAQLDFLLEKSVGDNITIKGKITSIGELLGYSIDIAEVY